MKLSKTKQRLRGAGFSRRSNASCRAALKSAKFVLEYHEDGPWLPGQLHLNGSDSTIDLVVGVDVDAVDDRLFENWFCLQHNPKMPFELWRFDSVTRRGPDRC